MVVIVPPPPLINCHAYKLIIPQALYGHPFYYRKSIFVCDNMLLTNKYTMVFSKCCLRLHNNKILIVAIVMWFGFCIKSFIWVLYPFFYINLWLQNPQHQETSHGNYRCIVVFYLTIQRHNQWNSNFVTLQGKQNFVW